ncbi:MAG: DNA-directed RNA polymerase subunit alpha C-terminal domain-containing protein [Oscillospiraceae bacterium]|nr:DNA-directed RNA polymerase subunit alpha C-terminal domain-containing protein [Oscillospiraceae bacterium]
MEQKMFFSTHAEYEVWLTENKDKIRECIYLKFLDVPFKEIQMSARAYNVLRINRLNYMSDIIFCSADDIEGLAMMSKSALDEILMFKRNYLKKHKRIFVNFINGVEETSESTTDVPVVEPITESAHLPEISSEKLVNIDEDDNIDSTTSATENTLLQAKKMLTDEFVKEKIISFFEPANVSLGMLNLSTRLYNALRRNGIQFLHQVIPYYPDGFIEFNSMGRGSAAEACEKTEKFIASYVTEISGYLNGREIIFKPHLHSISSNPTDEKGSLSATDNSCFHIKSLLADSRIKEKITDFFKVNVIAIDSLDLSFHSYNRLRKNGVLYLHQMIEYYPDGFASLWNMGKKSVEEACRKTETWVMSYLDEISDYIGEEYIKIQIPVKASFEDEKDPYKLSVPQMIKHPVFKDKAINYLKINDIPIELMGLSTRATNALKRSGILSFYASLSIYPDDIVSLNNIGNVTVNEIKTKIEYYITKLHDPLAAYCNGESNSLYSDEFVYDKVIIF